ncbi:MAG: hypothetical protein K6U03_03280 [Firmicutes bacterium]|nr:hypothetical protein [Bacillota bacterium]
MDAINVFQKDLRQWDELLTKITDLFLRMNTREAEIAATVHFVARELSSTGNYPSEQDVLEEVKRWKQRRRPPLGDEEIALSIRSLNAMNWLDLIPSPSLPLPSEDCY